MGAALALLILPTLFPAGVSNTTPGGPGDWILLDGKSAPATTLSQVVNGTRAHLTFWLSQDGSYELRSPTGASLGTVTSNNLNVTFRNIDLAANGWYTLHRVGVEVTRIEVVQYSGSLAIGANKILKMTASDLAAIEVADGPLFRGVFWDYYGTPRCGLYSASPPNSDWTWNLPLNSPRILPMYYDYYVHTFQELGPALGVTIATQSEPTFAGGAAILLWRFDLNPEPENTYPGVIRSVIHGIALGTAVSTVSGTTWAIVDDLNPLPPCRAMSNQPPLQWEVSFG